MADIAAITGKDIDDVAGMSGKALSNIAKFGGITKAAAQSGGSIVTTNLVQHLDAGDSNSYSGSGTTWYDISSNSIDVALVNGPTYSSTEGGGSLSFDGVNDSGRMYYSSTGPIRPTYSDLNSNGFTVQVWLKMAQGDSGTVWSSQMYSQRQYYGLQLNYDNRVSSNNGRIIMHMMDGDGNYASYSRRSAVFTQTGNGTDWKFVTFRYDNATNSNWTGFIGSTKFSSPTTSGTGNGLGYRNLSDGSVASQYVSTGLRSNDMELAMILAYDVALTDQQVTDNYNATKSRFGQ
jgi:hypothetical protein